LKRRRGPLDLSTICAEFPALMGDTIYLDNAGGTQVLRRVADRISDHMLTTSVQLGASYRQSVQADERVLEGRRSVAIRVNAYHDDEMVFGGSSTPALVHAGTGPAARPAPRRRNHPDQQ
jgi:selenocysteine lyase/cysteine desulfurase